MSANERDEFGCSGPGSIDSSEPWQGTHPPPAPPIAEPCGCDESKVLRLELTALRARLARVEGGA